MNALLAPVTGRVTVAAIKAMVAADRGCTVADLESERRGWLAIARQMAMHLAKELTPHSYVQIGRFIGDRDHSTVIKGIRSIERRRQRDPEIDATMRRLKDALRPPVPEQVELQDAFLHGPLFDLAPARPSSGGGGR